MVNIAELLKDCPNGMELDCVLFENLEFDRIDKDTGAYSIICRVKTEWGCYNTHTFTEYGCYTTDKYSKCAIFPKGKTTWEGFVPLCKFKDGDVISNSLGTCIFKGEGMIKGTVDYYCGIHADYFRVKDHKQNPKSHYGNIADYRLATKEEKKELFKAIKEYGYRWNAKNNILVKLIKPKFKVGDRIRHKNDENIINTINYVYNDSYGLCDGHLLFFNEQDQYELYPYKFDINKLKSFDKVLVRLDNCNQWYATLFSHIDERQESFCRRYVTVSGKSYTQMIPYEGNERLCGTKDDCDEFYKTW